MKRTFQPSNLVRKRRHGFRARMSAVGGRNVIAARRSKGRKRLSAQTNSIIIFLKIMIKKIKSRSDF